MPVDGVGSAVRRARLAAGLTQRDLARDAGLSLGALRDLEQGRSTRPRPDTLAALAHALGLGAVEAFAPVDAAAGDTAPGLPDPAVRAPVVVRVLGPLAVRDGDGDLRAVDGRGQALTLGLLALHGGDDVGHGELLDLLWPAGPPANAAALLRSYVARVRRRLVPHGIDIEAAAGRYRLVTPPDACDVARFRADLRVAEAAGDARAETAALADALALWPLTPPSDLAELRSHPLAVGLERERVRATVRSATAAVAAGEPDAVVGPVTALAEREPLDESLAAAAVTVLAAAGRMADVHAVYTRTRRALAEDLGLDPGPELATAFREALHRGRPGPADASVADAHVPDPDRKLPAQLPRTLRRFHGRTAELERVVELLSAPRSSAPPVVVVSGMGGLGKTTLAVAAAHAVSDHYPGGQLFTDLDGVGEPLSTAAVLEHFLVSLGHERADLPGDLARLVTTFRTATADARCLVVLDNAAGTEQIEALLPAGPGCGVLVTSRRPLTDLDDATHLPLGILAAADAVELVAAGVGTERTRREEAAVDEIVALCGGLPLALRMVVARLTANPSWRVGDVAAMLGDEHGRLDVLRSGGRAVRASFELSHRGLSARGARVFRTAALAPGPTVAPATVAAALGADEPVDRVRADLDDLVDRALLGDAPGGRYRFHDLVRAFADGKGREHAAESAAARLRVLHWLEETSSRATATTYPHRIGAVPASGPARSADLGDPAVQAAGAWLDAELETLAAAVTTAATLDPALTWRLADAVNGALRRATTSQEFEQVARTGLAAAEAAGDARGRGLMADMLARAHVARYDHERAARWFEQAVAAAVATGWAAFEVSTRENLGISWLVLGRHEAATAQFEASLRLAADLGLPYWVAANRNDLGNVAVLHGRIAVAQEHYRAALTANEALGDAVGYVVNLSNLANAERLAGRPAAAWDLVLASLHHPHAAVDRAVFEETRIMQAEIALDLGRSDEAADLAARALTATRRLRQVGLEARAHLASARARLARGEVGPADRAARTALDLARGSRDAEFARGAHLVLADTALAAGDTAGARRQAAAAARMAAHLDDLGASGEAALALARVLLGEGDVDAARGALHLAHSAFGLGGHGRGLAETAALDTLVDAPVAAGGS